MREIQKRVCSLAGQEPHGVGGGGTALGWGTGATVVEGGAGIGEEHTG